MSTNNADLLARKAAATPRGVAVMGNFFVERAEGALLFDIEGRRYIDFAAGIAVMNVGHGHSLRPNIIPPTVSIHEAAGPPQSLGFALVGALLIIPMILMYTAWGYWVFRGKVRRGDGYH